MNTHKVRLNVESDEEMEEEEEEEGEPEMQGMLIWFSEINNGKKINCLIVLRSRYSRYKSEQNKICKAVKTKKDINLFSRWRTGSVG